MLVVVLSGRGEHSVDQCFFFKIIQVLVVSYFTLNLNMSTLEGENEVEALLIKWGVTERARETLKGEFVHSGRCGYGNEVLSSSFNLPQI